MTFRTTILGTFVALGATRAVAQPTPEPAPTPTPIDKPAPVEPVPPDAPVPPVAPSAPPPPMALDGDARSLERRPESSGIRGGFLLHGVGVGASWVVRAVMAPFRGLIYTEARWQALTRIHNLLVNHDRTLGIYPTVGFQSDFGLSFGAKAFAKNYFDGGEELSVSASAGGFVTQAYQAKLDVPAIGGSPLYVRARARFEENTNQIFAGIGSSPVDAGTMLAATEAAIKTRFSQTRYLALLSTGVQLGDRGGTRLRLGGSAILNDRAFGPAGTGVADPSIETVYDTSTLRGFDEGVTTLELTGELELDTRDTEGPTQTGAVIHAFGGGGSLVEQTRYAHYGAEASYYLAPFWPRRVFVGRVALEGVVDRNNDIPFTELPRLGGPGLLRGFSTGQFRDRLLAIATLEYHYPIHENISGQLFVETGKVARTYDALLGGGLRDAWHVGYGGGLVVHSRSSVKVRIDVAYGDGINVYFSTDVLDAFRKREREL